MDKLDKLADLNIQDLDKSKIYLVTVPDNYGKEEILDILKKFKIKGIECLIARRDLIVSEYKGSPKITLQEVENKIN